MTKIYLQVGILDEAGSVIPELKGEIIMELETESSYWLISPLRDGTELRERFVRIGQEDAGTEMGRQ